MKERLEFEIKILSSVQDQKRKKGQRLEFKTKKIVLSSRTVKSVLNGNVLSARPKKERKKGKILSSRLKIFRNFGSKKCLLYNIAGNEIPQFG